MLVGVVGFLGSEVVLSPVVSGCVPLCGGWVLVGVAALLGSEVVLSPVVSGFLPSCGGWVLVGVAASITKIFRNQNHRFHSKFAYCKLFGVYAGVIPPFRLLDPKMLPHLTVFVSPVPPHTAPKRQPLCILPAEEGTPELKLIFCWFQRKNLLHLRVRVDLFPSSADCMERGRAGFVKMGKGQEWK